VRRGEEEERSVHREWAEAESGVRRRRSSIGMEGRISSGRRGGS
jgi:hypothetical protein